MAAPIRITEAAIRSAALDLVRAQGPQALNARALAAALGCSTQPIFKNYPSMEALRRAVVEEALGVYHRFVEQAETGSSYPSYKARGMGYINFARREPTLFRLLFMRSRGGESESPEDPDWPADAARAGTSAGLSGPEAELFHLEMWAFVHGIAVMTATGYLTLEEETVSRMLSDAFRGIKTSWEAGT